MTSDVLNLKMSREQFLAYDEEQQKGIMFSFLTSIDNKLDTKFSVLDKEGCAFAQKYIKESKYTRLKMVGVGFAVSMPVIYILAKLFVPGCP